jgi:hypothetical protein
MVEEEERTGWNKYCEGNESRERIHFTGKEYFLFMIFLLFFMFLYFSPLEGEE